MVFASLSFLLLFFIPVLVLYYVLPQKLRNYVLLAASIVFYMLGGPVYILLLVAVIVWSWIFGLLIDCLWLAGIEPARIGTLGSNLRACRMFFQMPHSKAGDSRQPRTLKELQALKKQ